MSGPSLCMLVRLMVAQVQECVFERVTLTTQDTYFTSQLRLAQEAARVRAHDMPLVCLCCYCLYPVILTMYIHVHPIGVGCLPVGAADHDAASDEGLRAVFVGIHGSGQS